MAKLLSPTAAADFERDGFLPAIPVLSPEEVRYFRAAYERFEKRHPEHVKKLKSKSHLLCPWVVELASHPKVLDAFEDLIGPNILCWSMAWRVKEPDGKTFAGWHQDSVYLPVKPILVFGTLALSDCSAEAGCLRVIPGSHKWAPLPHADSEDRDSILARGQYISAEFDKSKAVDLALRPGEMALINNAIVHSSAPNRARDRRMMVLVEMMPTQAVLEGSRDSALLVRGVDEFHHFDADPRPEAEFSPAAQAAWKRVIDIRAKVIFSGSELSPSVAYGGTRPAT